MELSAFNIEQFFSNYEEGPLEQDDDNSIAVIGMAGIIGAAQNLTEFWEGLLNQETFNNEIGNDRKEDLINFLKTKDSEVNIEKITISKGSMLEEIAMFDPSFFNISRQEAIFMDPNQRMFMELSWEALEDAGYAGEAIKGSNTGIFVGVSTNLGEEYTNIIRTLEPEAPEVSVTGNIKSIMAGRVAHFLDLNGPAMTIDTACSSGLTAVYTAMRFIQNGDIDMAIVGGVKCEILPMNDTDKMGVGIRELDNIISPNCTTSTFDQSCSGTFPAEGGLAFVLKSLKKARKDKDHIYSVILGGAVNQDGDSNGLTAPNPKAQEKLITAAMKDANINPERISYIEAHGTGTKLGDPIEIKAISNAFEQYTDKKQFVSIGSVKTNIGHLDNISGLIGMAKVIMSMQHNHIPASLNFMQPNSGISFINSPVYVNAKPTVWSESSEEVLAGVSSFGLSGTNCHIILKSCPTAKLKSECNQNCLFTLSHKTESGLKELAEKYLWYFQNSNEDIQDCAYTAYVGRRHMECRFAVVFADKEDLCKKLQQYVITGYCGEGMYSGRHKISMIWNAGEVGVKYITYSNQQEMTHQANVLSQHMSSDNRHKVLSQMGKLYISGAELPPESVVYKTSPSRVSLPHYNFKKDRLWVRGNSDSVDKGAAVESDKAIITKDSVIVSKIIKAEKENWVIYEHKIGDTYVMPGTAYIEMVLKTFKKVSSKTYPIRLKNLVFHQPFSLKEGEKKELQICMEIKNKVNSFTVDSCRNGEWMTHLTGTLEQYEGEKIGSLNIHHLKSEIVEPILFNAEQDRSRGLYLGKHWMDCVLKGSKNQEEDQFLIETCIDTPVDKRSDFYFHPSLTDTSINAMNSYFTEDTLYLPLSYGELILFDQINGHIFIHMRKTRTDSVSNIICFDMQITDSRGKVLGVINNYVVKEAIQSELFHGSDNEYGYIGKYIKYSEKKVLAKGQKEILFIYDSHTTLEFMTDLRERFHAYRIKELDLRVTNLKAVAADVKSGEISSIIYIADPMPIPNRYEESYTQSLLMSLEQSMKFIKSVVGCKLIPDQNITILVKNLDNAEEVHCMAPERAALSGLWKIAIQEYPSYKYRYLEFTSHTKSETLIEEIFSVNRPTFVAYKGENAYIETIEKSEQTLMYRNNQLFEIDSDLKTGIFIITGGSGDLAVETASFLVKKGVKNIALFVHHPLPQRDKWTEGNLKRLAQIEGILDNLEVIMVDLCQFEQVEKAIRSLNDKYLNIKGLVHSAGKAGNGYILSKEWTTFSDVFSSKAITALNLHYALLPYQIEYFVTYSSMTSIVLENGQSDYTAANSFMDALVRYRNQCGLSGNSIQWPAWRETGMAKRMNAVAEDDVFHPLNTKEALALFDQIIFLGKKYPNVLIPGKKHQKEGKQTISQTEHPLSVKLTGVAVPNKYEMQIGQVWSEILLQEELDVHDEFSALGGNSLFISKMLAVLDKQYPGIMDIADLFTYTTIARQAEYIRSVYEQDNPNSGQTDTKSGDDDIGSILEMLAEGKIDLEETFKLIR